MAASKRAAGKPAVTERVPGAVVLACGVAFLGAGGATGNPSFHALGPVFIALGAALLARSRRSP